MAIIERYEVQETHIWYRAEITEEQKVEYLKWQAEGAQKNQWPPDWVDELDWDHHSDRPGQDDIISEEIVDEEMEQ